MPGRTVQSGEYRYGFNGKEKDENGEWGNQTHYDYGARIYNPGIAKFLSVDPLTKRYAYYTPYQFAGNGPIQNVDIDGLEPLSLQEKEILKEQAAELGMNTIIISAPDQVHATGSYPVPARLIAFDYITRPIEDQYKRVYTTDFSTTDHRVYVDVIEIAEPKVVSEQVVIIDSYQKVWERNFNAGAASRKSEFHVNVASLFGPTILGAVIKNGKFSLKFLKNVGKAFTLGATKYNKVTPTIGFRNKGVQEKFTKAFNGIKNKINNAMNDSGIEGAIKDLHGLPSNGQHLKKVEDGLKGLGNGSKELQKLIDNGDLAADALSAARDAIKQADAVAEYARGVLKTATRSAKKHTADGTL